MDFHKYKKYKTKYMKQSGGERRYNTQQPSQELLERARTADHVIDLDENETFTMYKYNNGTWEYYEGHFYPDIYNIMNGDDEDEDEDEDEIAGQILIDANGNVIKAVRLTKDQNSRLFGTNYAKVIRDLSFNFVN